MSGKDPTTTIALGEGEDRFLTVAAVAQIVPWSQPWIWQQSKLGNFPKPIKLSPQRTVWSMREIQEWIAAKLAERGKAG